VWVGTYGEFWEESFERLDDYLDSLQQDETRQQESSQQEKDPK
jgi:hypothetical protein